jgi:integrase/recombinase XerD
MQKESPGRLDYLAEQFFEWLKVSGFTESSQRSYRIYLRKFLSYLKEQKIESLDRVTPKVVYGYQTSLYYTPAKEGMRNAGKPLSVLTQHNALTVVKTFFKFLIESDKITYDPSSGIQLPKKPERLPEILTVEEMEKLLETADTSTILGFRDRTIMEVLYITGMRNAELCSLNIDDVDLGNQEIRIRQGKGGKQRIVPLGDVSGEYCSEYLQAIRPKLERRTRSLTRTEPEYGLFLSKTGRRLGQNDLIAMIRMHARKAGLEKNVTAHTFRHTCATHMLQGGADIRYIQKLLGHESITSTQLYTQVEITDLKKIHEQYHPREQ